MPPPTDDLFDDSAETNATGAAKGTEGTDGAGGAGKGAAGAGGPRLAEQLATLTTSIGKLVETQTQTNQRVEALTQRVQTAAPETKEEEEPALGADGNPLSPEAKKFSKFYSNPESFIREEAGKLVREQLGPHLLTQAGQRAEELEKDQAARIDAEFGDGTWDSEYSKDFRETLGKLPIEMQSNRKHVEAAVAAIHGTKFLTTDSRKGLEERRQKVDKAKLEANQAPAMLANGRPAPRRDATVLSAEEAAFITKLNDNGIPYTREQYLASRERGSTESKWKVAKQAASGKGRTT